MIHAVAVTYRRPEQIVDTLGLFANQTRPPDTQVVIDNDADDDVRRIVEGHLGVPYVPLADNAGPAGAIAVGMQEVLLRAADCDWILLIDDDDPPPFDTALERLAEIAFDLPSDVAGVGLAGSRYDRRTGVLSRLRDDELTRITDVDYLGGNQLPLYRVAAIRDVGGFLPELFFGFEELEFGLRLRDRGYRVVIERELTLAVRDRYGRLGLGRRAPADRSAQSWRTYYSSRNQLLIARRYGRWPARALVTARTLAGGFRGAVRSRSIHVVTPRVRGLLDGWRGRTGKTVVP